MPATSISVVTNSLPPLPSPIPDLVPYFVTGLPYRRAVQYIKFKEYREGQVQYVQYVPWEGPVNDGYTLE
jgi:hypothetical protein